MLDGILYQLRNGCSREDLPKDLPPIERLGTETNTAAANWLMQQLRE
nr:MAG: hypothetical protein EDM05_25135 [Leptolyngbya sp. IPPAS B-1204]